MYQYNDGGRIETGRKGNAGDCVARAIAIAAELPYDQVYKDLAAGNATQRTGKHNGKAHGQRTARNGIMTNRKWFKDYMASLGFTWTPTMAIGQGCKVHLTADELPKGRLVVAVSRHYTAVIDGIINDTFNPQRGSTIYGDGRIVKESRCVYGYWSK